MIKGELDPNGVSEIRAALAEQDTIEFDSLDVIRGLGHLEVTAEVDCIHWEDVNET